MIIDVLMIIAANIDPFFRSSNDLKRKNVRNGVE